MATIDMGQKEGGCCVPFAGGMLSPRLTHCSLGRGLYFRTKWCLLHRHHHHQVIEQKDRSATYIDMREYMWTQLGRFRYMTVSIIHDSFGRPTKWWTVSVHNDFGTYEINFGTWVFSQRRSLYVVARPSHHHITLRRQMQASTASVSEK